MNPRSAKELTAEQRKVAIAYLMFLKRKKTGDLWSPAVAIDVAAESLLSEKVTMSRRFERSTIWFKLDSEKQDWFWTPYRDGEELSELDRWILIHHYVVVLGLIMSILANNGDLLSSETLYYAIALLCFCSTTQDCSVCVEGKLLSSCLYGAVHEVQGSADGRKQRAYISKEESTSPTVATELVFLTAVIDEYEQRNVAVVKIPGACMQTSWFMYGLQERWLSCYS